MEWILFGDRRPNHDQKVIIKRGSRQIEGKYDELFMTWIVLTLGPNVNCTEIHIIDCLLDDTWKTLPDMPKEDSADR